MNPADRLVEALRDLVRAHDAGGTGPAFMDASERVLKAFRDAPILITLETPLQVALRRAKVARREAKLAAADYREAVAAAEFAEEEVERVRARLEEVTVGAARAEAEGRRGDDDAPPHLLWAAVLSYMNRSADWTPYSVQDFAIAKLDLERQADDAAEHAIYARAEADEAERAWEEAQRRADLSDWDVEAERVAEAEQQRRAAREAVPAGVPPDAASALSSALRRLRRVRDESGGAGPEFMEAANRVAAAYDVSRVEIVANHRAARELAGVAARDVGLVAKSTKEAALAAALEVVAAREVASAARAEAEEAAGSPEYHVNLANKASARAAASAQAAKDAAEKAAAMAARYDAVEESASDADWLRRDRERSLRTSAEPRDAASAEADRRAGAEAWEREAAAIHALSTAAAEAEAGAEQAAEDAQYDWERAEGAAAEIAEATDWAREAATKAAVASEAAAAAEVKWERALLVAARASMVGHAAESDYLTLWEEEDIQREHEGAKDPAAEDARMRALEDRYGIDRYESAGDLDGNVESPKAAEDRVVQTAEEARVAGEAAAPPSSAVPAVAGITPEQMALLVQLMEQSRQKLLKDLG